MSGSNDCFFGEKVTKDVSRKVNVMPGMMLHLSHAALDHVSDGKPPVSLSVNNGQEDFLICTLRDCGHTPLDLNFSNPITLKVKGGPSAIHVTGYWEVMGDPEMDFEEDEEEEEEEEAPAAAAPAKKASPKAVAKPSPKSSPKSSPKQAAQVVSTKEEAPAQKQSLQALAKSMGLPEELGDDESISSSLLREMMEGMEEMEEFEEDDEEDEELAQLVGQKRAAPAPAAAQSQPPQKKAKGIPPPPRPA
ncbi:FK506-binding protein 4 [Diplonema papillatum]|nr:FK506-binding protein 4 [Diplonema papillatum]